MRPTFAKFFECACFKSMKADFECYYASGPLKLN